MWQPVWMTLNPVQIRVLGALIEKEIATPENYPLSLNTLVNACNQRSSRDPVMDLGEEEIRQALHTLEDFGLTTVVRDSRVAKFEHRARTLLNLRRDETAVLCLLFLRGPQTTGELRTRSDRLYSFDDLDAVQSTLDRLISRPLGDSNEGAAARSTGPLVVMLQRQPGSRESRYAHLLGGPMAANFESSSEGRGQSRAEGSAEQTHEMGQTSSAAIRLKELEVEVIALRKAVATIEARLSHMEDLAGVPVSK